MESWCMSWNVKSCDFINVNINGGVFIVIDFGGFRETFRGCRIWYIRFDWKIGNNGVWKKYLISRKRCDGLKGSYFFLLSLNSGCRYFKG